MAPSASFSTVALGMPPMCPAREATPPPAWLPSGEPMRGGWGSLPTHHTGVTPSASHGGVWQSRLTIPPLLQPNAVLPPWVSGECTFFLQPPFCTTGWLEGSGLVPPKKNSVALKYFALEKGTPAGMIGMDWGRDAGMHGGLCFWECNPNPNIQDLESLPGFLFFYAMRTPLWSKSCCLLVSP